MLRTYSKVIPGGKYLISIFLSFIPINQLLFKRMYTHGSMEDQSGRQSAEDSLVEEVEVLEEPKSEGQRDEAEEVVEA